MSIQVLPVEPEDCATWQRMHDICHRGPMRNLILTRPLSEESWAQAIEGRKRELSDPGVFMFKAVDTSTSPSTITSIAKWTLHVDSAKLEAKKSARGNTPEPRPGAVEVAEGTAAAPAAYQAKFQDSTPASLKHMKNGPPPEVNLDIMKAFLGPLREACKEFMAGKEFVMLNSLTTFPEFQKKGHGRMLMRWGLDKADELGVEVYLDSTEAARHLYESEGFECVRTHSFDMSKWGGEGFENHWTYIRKAKQDRQS